MSFPFVDELVAALGGADDPDLWRLVADTFSAGLESRIELRINPPRHLVVGFARVSPRARAAHPEEHATLRMHWGRERGGEVWEPLGPNPRPRRKRGHYLATVCVPGASRRLAVATVRVAWRPRLPWAPPTDTEPGRQEMLLMRRGDDTWELKGTR